MFNTDIYDKEGQDGIDNAAAFNAFPKIMQYFIVSQQNVLFQKVENNVRKKYGQAGVDSLVKTSGFRSRVTNARNGGVYDSLHLYGLAIDFAKTGIFKDKPIPVCCNLQLIDSGDCWHVQFSRGK